MRVRDAVSGQIRYVYLYDEYAFSVFRNELALTPSTSNLPFQEVTRSTLAALDSRAVHRAPNLQALSSSTLSKCLVNAGPLSNSFSPDLVQSAPAHSSLPSSLISR